MASVPRRFFRPLPALVLDGGFGVFSWHVGSSPLPGP